MLSPRNIFLQWSLLALFVLGLVVCAFDCAAGDDDHARDTHCATHCICQMAYLPQDVPMIATPATPACPPPLPAGHLRLPLFVADIFNPPKV